MSQYKITININSAKSEAEQAAEISKLLLKLQQDTVRWQAPINGTLVDEAGEAVGHLELEDDDEDSIWS